MPDIMSHIRSRLLMREPFWGSLAMNLKVVVDPKIKTLCVNNVELHYNPEYLASLNPMEQEAVVAHEVGHLMLGHIFRRQTRDMYRWNVACDRALNPLLSDSGFLLPANVLDGTPFKGMSAEAIYSKDAEQQQQEQEQQESGQGAPEDGSGDSSEESEDGATDGSEDGQNGDSEGSEGVGGTPEAPEGQESSQGDASGQENGSDGPSEMTQTMPGSPTGGFSDPVPGEDGESGETPMTEQDWQIAVEQAVKVATAAGKLPAGIASAVIASRESRVDWTAELRDFFVRNTPSDQSWTTPNRRYAAAGLYLPGTIKQNVGEIVLAVDTSGSTAWMQRQFATEFGSILREVRPEKLWLVYCDAAVQDVVEASPEDFDLEFKPKGFGGTRFQPVFDWVEKQGIEPLAMVYLTDLCCCDTPEPPSYPVLWATSLHETYPPPNFGDVVRIPMECER